MGKSPLPKRVSLRAALLVECYYVLTQSMSESLRPPPPPTMGKVHDLSSQTLFSDSNKSIIIWYWSALWTSLVLLSVSPNSILSSQTNGNPIRNGFQKMLGENEEGCLR